MIYKFKKTTGFRLENKNKYLNTVLYLHGTIETFHLSIESYYCNTQFHKQNNRFNSLRQFLKMHLNT